MKKNLQFLFVFAAMLFCCGNAFAGSTSTQSVGRAYFKDNVPTASGKVYVSTSDTEDTTQYKSCTDPANLVASAEVTGQNTKTTYYFYAKPNDGYVFAGWYSKNSATNEYTLQSSTQLTSSFVHSGSATTGSNPNSGTTYVYLDRYAAFVKVVTYSFITPTNGSYTIKNNGVSVSGYPENMQVNGIVELSATPGTGKRVMGWYSTNDGGATKQYFAFGDKCELNFDNDATIGVDFCDDNGNALFWVEDGNVFDDLSLAISSVLENESKKIIVIKGGNVPPKMEGDDIVPYVIPSNITLLVPFENTYICYTTQPGVVHGNSSTKKVFCSLTLLDQTRIEVNGAISVSAKHASGDGGQYHSSSVYGNYGQIDMLGRSSITINSGGKLYVWGYIIGSDYKEEKPGVKEANEYKCGVIVNDGGIAYEEFEFTDHHGGGSMSSTYNKAFIFNQYYVQSIETPITILPGAKELGFCTFYVEGEKNTNINYLGTGGLFSMSGDGSKVIKQYNPVTDRLYYDVYGTVEMGSMVVSSSIGNLNTTIYIMPLTNNMSITIHEGSTTTVKYDASMLPDSEIEVEEGATLKINNTFFVYDSTEWCISGTKYAQEGWVSPLKYTGSNKKDNANIRSSKLSTAGSVFDAKLLVNGTLQVDGYLMSTTTGGNICSKQEGAQIVLNHSGVNQTSGSCCNKKLYQVNGTSKSATQINTTPAKLRHGDGTYFNTDGTSGKGTYKYMSNKWIKISEVTFMNGTDLIREDSVAQGAAIAAPVDIDNPTKEGYTFKDWGELGNMGVNDTTIQAQWTPIDYTITFNSNEGSAVNAIIQGYETAITAPANPTREGFVFDRWEPALPATMPLGGGEYTAQWKYKIVNIEVTSDSTEIIRSDGSKETPTKAATYTIGDGVEAISAQSDTVVIESNATLEIANNVSLDVATTITVDEGATLNVADDATVKAKAIVLNASPSDIDIENDKAGSSSQVLCNNEDALNDVTDIYIDIKMDKRGTLDGSSYYAFAVPFIVNINGGVQKINSKGEVSEAINNTHYRAYTYNGEHRATNGKGSNWDQVMSGTFNPGVFYLIEFADGSYNTFRFIKASGEQMNNAGDIPLTGYGDKDPNNSNNGWNGIANNALQSATINVSGGVAQVFDPISKIFTPAELGSTNFSIGTPLMVQVLNDGTATNSPVVASAPARMMAQTDDETLGNYTVRIKAEGATKMADQMFISASENAQSNYVIGKDLVKMFMGDATVAQLWVNDYGKKLSMNQAVLADDVATASLTLYAPKAGEYTIYLKDVPEDATIYLLDDGAIVSNLNDGGYVVTLAKGENTQYSLRINARNTPGVVTSVEEALAGKDLQKVLLDGVVYIVRDGQLYNVLGQQR